MTVISSTSKFPRDALLELNSTLLGSFMILDSQPSSDLVIAKGEAEGAYVDVAFGDPSKSFDGFHRFEVLRIGGSLLENIGSEEMKEFQPEMGKGGVVLRYASVSCNPSADQSVPTWLWTVHKFYALCLFRDATREVLYE